MLARLKTFLDVSCDYPTPARSISNQGLRNYLHLRLSRRQFAKLPPGQKALFRSKRAQFPLACRAGTTDLKVFSQIFLFREYSCLDHLKQPGLIIDCGANGGYSSAYFLSQFPSAHVIAIEPDPGNFALLQENLSPYGSRARTIQSAIWSHPAQLVLAETPFRDGMEWARQVRECSAEEPGSFLATDIESILRASGYERVSILKIDIEGAEGVVFSHGYESWLDRVDALVIELHRDSIFGDSPAIFNRAIAGRGFEITQSGELTVCLRNRGRS